MKTLGSLKHTYIKPEHNWDKIHIGLALSVQETVLIVQNTCEIQPAQQTLYIREVEA